MVERRRVVAVVQPKSATQNGPDIDEARRFLSALGPGDQEFQFQTFDDNQNRKQINKNLAADFNCSLFGAAKTLARANNQGAGVFVSVNETDGLGQKKRT